MSGAITTDVIVVGLGVVMGTDLRCVIGVCALVVVIVKYRGARARLLSWSRGCEWRWNFNRGIRSTVFLMDANKHREWVVCEIRHGNRCVEDKCTGIEVEVGDQRRKVRVGM